MTNDKILRIDILYTYINSIYHITKEEKTKLELSDLFIILDKINDLFLDKQDINRIKILPDELTERLNIYKLISCYYVNGYVDDYFMTKKTKFNISTHNKEEYNNLSLLVKSYFINEMMNVAKKYGLKQ